MNRTLTAISILCTTALMTASCTSSSTDTGDASASIDDGSIAECVNAGDSEWRATVDRARSGGRVVMYSTLLPEINDNLEKAFEEGYPDIDLVITRVIGEEISATLDAERSTGTDGADIVSHINYNWMLDHLDDGYFTVPTGPNSAGPNWKGTENLIDDVFQVSLLTGIGFAWRTDLVEDPPTGYEDLLDPKFAQGRIGITTGERASSADIYAWMTDTFGPDYLTKLAAQEPVVYSSAVPLLEALIAGEISVTGYASSIGVAKAKAQGAPIEFALPDPGWAPLNLTYMLADSARPDAAQVLFNFMACDAGQAALANQNVSVQPNIPGTLGAPESVTPANLARMTSPGWIESFYPQWADTFRR
ncbi:extracellular solute-binding protein [Rhodococcus fascians]|nr:extracellular solute-binding protein [Rhodococcus fascians]MBY4238716.1 extracellular solute-binding protein [Rhodococcus fascians]MBY4270071.1 extracellular solute-binding protein [Rhodococcus fascians]